MSTTERGAGGRGRFGPRGRTDVPGLAAVRGLLEVRIPAHVGVMLGVSTAAYAVTLAGVAGLQSGSDAALVAERAPAIARIHDLSTGNAGLEAEVTRLASSYDGAAAQYAAAGDRLASLQTALADLATRVQQIDGVSRSLPSSVALPRLSRPTVKAPSTSATTGASGAPPP